MDRIIDSVDRHGVRWVGIVQGKGATAMVWQVEDAESSQALAVRYVRSKQSWEHFSELLLRLEMGNNHFHGFMCKILQRCIDVFLRAMNLKESSME